MQNSIWKITALAGVVGLGFLVLLQIQRGMPDPKQQFEAAQEFDADGDQTAAHLGEPESDVFPPEQSEEPSPEFSKELGTGQKSAEHRRHPLAGDTDSDSFLSTAGDGLDFRPQPGDAAADDDRVNGRTTPTERQTRRPEPARFNPFAQGDRPRPIRGKQPQGVVFADHDEQELGRTGNSFRQVSGETDADDDAGPQFGPLTTSASKRPTAADETIGGDRNTTTGSDNPQVFDLLSPPTERKPEPNPFPSEARPNSIEPVEKSQDDFNPFPDESKQRQPASEAVEVFDPFAADETGIPSVPANEDRDPQLRPNEPQGFPALDEEMPAKDAQDAVENPFARESQADTDEETPPNNLPPTKSGAGPVITDRYGNRSASPPEKTDSSTRLIPPPVRVIEREPLEEINPFSDSPMPTNSLPETQFDQTETQPASPPKELNRAPQLKPIPAAGPKEVAGDGTIEENAPQGSQRPQLTIEKTAPPNALLGRPMIYSILVKNTGDSPASKVVVEDRVPKGTTLSGTIPRAELHGTLLKWQLGKLNPGEERKIRVRVIPTSQGEVGSIATVNFVSEVAAKTIITSPKLKLELIGPDQAELGEPVVFQFKIANIGTGDAVDVVIRNVLPDRLSHPGGEDLEYEVGTLAAGESRQVKLTLTAEAAGNAINRAVATAKGGLTTKAQADIEIVETRLNLSRRGPLQRNQGQTAVYENTLTNDSKHAATEITVVEYIPAGMRFVEATAGGKLDEKKRAVVWRIDRIGPKESKILKTTLVPKLKGEQTSTVSVYEGGQKRTETTSKTTVEGFSAISLNTSEFEGPVEQGQEVAFRLRARNRGTASARNVDVQISIPAELELVSIKGAAKYTQKGNVVTFKRIPQIKEGQQVQFDIVLRARKAGNGRVSVQVQTEQLTKPLTRDEPVIVF